MSGALTAIGIGTATAAEVGAPLAAAAGGLELGAGALSDAAIMGGLGEAGAGASAAASAATAGSMFSVGNLLSLAGTGFGALQQMQAGGAAKSAADYNAAVQNQQAGQEEAASERTAIGQNQQTQLVLSRARAIGSASGATGTSGSVISDEGQIKDRGDLNALMDLYNGESRATALREGAGLQEFQGQQAQSAAPVKALSTIMSGASSLYSRYSPNPFGNSFNGVAGY